MVTIALADDHHLVRNALKISLQGEPGFAIAGEAADGIEAVALVLKKKPDVLLLDLTLPRRHGLEVVREVTHATKTKVVVVSMHTAEPYVVEAIKNGATGYVLKESKPGDLVKAIRAVMNGEIYLSPSLPQNEILDAVKADSTPRKRKSGGSAALTRQEKIVLQLAAEGNSNAQIGKLLYLSPRTIESHRASFMKKLKLRSQTDIVRFAVRKNIISI